MYFNFDEAISFRRFFLPNQFEDNKSQRYNVPLSINTPAKKASDPKYEFKIVDKDTFAFQLIRKSTGTVL